MKNTKDRGSSSSGDLNLIKLCVGAETVEDLLDWQKSPRAKGPDGSPRHVTRMWPKRADALLDGGSIFWVFKGLVLCRQHILRLDEAIGEDGIRRCAIVLDRNVVRTHVQPRRAFQGWRYLSKTDAPADLGNATVTDDVPLPPRLQAALAEIGVR